MRFLRRFSFGAAKLVDASSNSLVDASRRALIRSNSKPGVRRLLNDFAGAEIQRLLDGMQRMILRSGGEFGMNKKKRENRKCQTSKRPSRG